MTSKEKLFNYCHEYVEERIKRIKEDIDNAQISANTETKSTVGDKYETGRAMAQLEIERASQQLSEAEKLLFMLNKLKNVKVEDRVVPGALVKTSLGLFYISISLGQKKLEQQEYLIISADAPLGRILIGKQVDDSFQWRDKLYKIDEIE